MSTSIYIPEGDLYDPNYDSDYFHPLPVTIHTCSDCTPDRIWEEANQAQYLVVNQVPVTAEAIQQLRHLRGIIQWGRNISQIDVQAATQQGILVAYTPYNIRGMAEANLLLMLALSKHLPLKMNSVKSSKAVGSFPAGNELYGKTLGLVGFNAVGQALAKLATAFGMRVLVYSQHGDRRQIAASGGNVVNLVSLLTGADFVSVHQDEQGPSPVFNTQHLGMMKPTAYFINADSPALVDEAALVDSLLSKRIAGAGLDALASDSLNNKHPLIKLDNVILTPQALGETAESYGTIKQGVKTALEAFLAGRLPEYVVNPEVAKR